VAVHPPTGFAGVSRRTRWLLIIGVVLLVLIFGGPSLINTYVDWAWFGALGFRGVFTTVLLTKVVLFVVVGAVNGGIVAAALVLAYRSRLVFVPVAGPADLAAHYRPVVMSHLRAFGIGIPVVIGLITGLVGQSHWALVQLFLHGTSFGQTDPQFGLDLGFYAFDLPFYRVLLGWAFAGVVLAFLASLVTHYLFGGLRLAGRGARLTKAARVQLAVLAGTFVLIKAVAYFFDRYELLSSNRNPQFTGASYTDLHAVLPAKLILLCIAVICAGAFFAGVVLRDLRVPALATALLVLSSILVGAAWPAILQQFSVNPNGPDREEVSIGRNIASTRAAYGITDQTVKYVDYPGTATVAPTAVAADTATISNVRLLDPTVLSRTFTQQQQLKNFYGFPNTLSVDRYTVDGQLRDFVVAARELAPNTLTGNQTNWVNQHTVYTHGNGFVAAAANKVNAALTDAGSGTGGYPVYTVADLNTKSTTIPVTQPRIYYGELIGKSTPDYAIVGDVPGAPPREYDTDSSSFTYNGAGGVSIGGVINRLAFAAKYGERNILFSSAVTKDSKIISNRGPRDRVSAVAPWLTTDTTTYPAVVDGRIKWIVDGYTTLDSLPYAQRTSLNTATADSRAASTAARQASSTPVSYIRNSVKATVDAYDGTVTLYSVDDQDPVLRAWEGVFPGVVKPGTDISPDLRVHFRYPQDLFKVQRDLLTRYNVSDPKEFFQNNGFWSVPADPTVDNNNGHAPQPPYYVQAADPTTGTSSFQLTSALVGLNREFLSAYMSASSNPDTYGQISVLKLPTDTQTQGPQQVQNSMLSAPQVSRERNLLGQQSTKIEYGNLLTLPVGKGGLLYVEPLYIERSAQASSYPQLARVLVSYNNQVGYAPTLAQALDQVFGAGAGSGTTAPANPTPTSPPTSGATPTPSSSPAATSTAPPPSGAVPVPQAIDNLNTALRNLKTAQAGGDFAALGQALTKLDTAVKAYQQATRPGTAGPPAPPTTTAALTPSAIPPPTAAP